MKPDIDTILYAPTNTGVRALQRALDGLHFETQRPLCDAIPWSRCGSTALVGPAVGAPAAVLACETVLGSSRCSRIVLFGACGGLSFDGSDLVPGDIVLPTASIRDDGTSLLYGAPEQFPLVSDVVPELSLKRCPVWTTDAPLLENVGRTQMFFERGARAVEMELAALAHLTALRAVPFSALLVVTDLVGNINRREFKSAAVQDSFANAAQAIAKLLGY